MEFKVAILGFGASAMYFHSASIAAVPTLRVVAAFDPVEPQRQVARRRGIEHALDPALLRSSIHELGLDVVVVCSPNSEHLSQALEALEAGAHVMIEKPVCFDAESFARLLEVADRRGRRLVPFHNRRHDTDHQEVVRGVRTGVIGRLCRVDLTAARVGPWSDHATPAFDPTWRAQSRWGGGVWNDWGPHLLDQLLRIVDDGLPRCTDAWFASGGTSGTAESMAVVQFRWETCVGRILVSSNDAEPHERARVVGTDGTIVVRGNDSSGEVIITTATGASTRRYATPPDSGAPLYRLLVEALAGGPTSELNRLLVEAGMVYDLLGRARRKALEW